MATDNCVLGIRDLEELRTLDLRKLRSCANSHLTTNECRHLLKVADAYFLHPGLLYPQIPHPQGYRMHLNGYTDFSTLFTMPNLCEIFGYQMVEFVRWRNGAEKIDWIIGPAMTAMGFLPFMAKFLEARFWVVEKDPEGKLTHWERFNILPGKKVLIASDVMTSAGGSAFETKRAIAEKNPCCVTFLPFSAVIMMHSLCPLLEDGTPVVFCHKLPEIKVYNPDDCPLCQAGSEPLRPKNRNNREKLLSYMHGV